MKSHAPLLAILPLLFTPMRAAGQTCGGEERWPVKVGSDGGATQVDAANPQSKTVHAVIGITRPQLPSDDTTRLEQETKVYVVEGRLVKFKLESGKTGDQDYHLVITDDTLQFSPGGSNTTPLGHGFVGEIVNPDCIPGRNGDPSAQSRFAQQLQNVRAKFEQQFPDITGGWNDAGGIPVRITGVGFFDRPHGQTGRALNGLEIHPILDISFGEITPPPPPPTSLIQDPSFEDQSQGWTATSDVITKDPRERAKTGKWKAWLGGHGKPSTDSLDQQISVPATATTVTLSFFLHISTDEESTNAFDTLKVQIKNAQGHTLKTLATYSNLDARRRFSLKTFDLSAYRGKTIRVYFASKEDKGSMTSFVIDDVNVVAE